MNSKSEWIDKLLKNSRSRATTAKLSFELKPHHIEMLWSIQEGLCHWFQIPLTTRFVAHEISRVSIDRLNNAKGYAPDNVVLASIAANMGRRDTPVPIFEAYCKKLIATRMKNESAAPKIKADDVFGKLRAIKRVPSFDGENWLFLCECGKRLIQLVSTVRSNIECLGWSSCADCYHIAGGWKQIQQNLIDDGDMITIESGEWAGAKLHPNGTIYATEMVWDKKIERWVPYT